MTLESEDWELQISQYHDIRQKAELSHSLAQETDQLAVQQKHKLQQCLQEEVERLSALLEGNNAELEELQMEYTAILKQMETIVARSRVLKSDNVTIQERQSRLLPHLQDLKNETTPDDSLCNETVLGCHSLETSEAYSSLPLVDDEERMVTVLDETSSLCTIHLLDQLEDDSSAGSQPGEASDNFGQGNVSFDRDDGFKAHGDNTGHDEDGELALKPVNVSIESDQLHVEMTFAEGDDHAPKDETLCTETNSAEVAVSHSNTDLRYNVRTKTHREHTELLGRLRVATLAKT